MKKLFIYVPIIGLVTGVVYWLCKKSKNNNILTKVEDNEEKNEATCQEESVSQSLTAVDEMYQTKSESVQAVYERHSEAGTIMKDAYDIILEDFVEDFSDEEVFKDEGEGVVIDSESVSVIEELDSISEELEDLLK